MAAAAWALVVAAAALAAGARGAPGATAAAEAANAVLRAHQLPGGLLPRWITAFRHDAATGRFEAELEAPCIARFEVDLRYNATVAGVISSGQIASISGVAAKDLFMWFRVQDIRIDDSSAGVIIFNVGVVKKHFPRAVFDAPPPCTPEPLTRTTPQRLEDVDGVLTGGAASQ
ncbi:uncharacterized protein LOC120709028 isoform X2 [Panicum virgatum]|uniref:uncharacterized protein LOC120709028 isoform X2 n=1 Tax=Panicum virgatum TaxID=38727 RepID=UPI0019D556AB|nr:uncharacterized protein LOC120709028 isoform X2 [Panicum virgatum]